MILVLVDDPRASAMTQAIDVAIEKFAKNAYALFGITAQCYYEAIDSVSRQEGDETIKERMQTLFRRGSPLELSDEDRSLVAAECAAAVITCRDAYGSEDQGQ